MTSKPVWTTKSGNLGTVPEQTYYELRLQAFDSDFEDAPILFEIVAGEPPKGIHLGGFGTLAGSPFTTVKVVGVPTNVSQATTSKFAVRGRVSDYFTTFVGDGSSTQFIIPTNIDFEIYRILVLEDDAPISAYYVQDDTQTNNITIILNRAAADGAQIVVGLYSMDSTIADRTFELTVVGENPPNILNPETIIGEYLEGNYLEYQIIALDLDDDTLEYTIVNGVLPPGVTIDSETGLISGYVELITFSTVSTTRYKSFQFGVLVDDGKLTDLQTFEIRIVPTKLMAASTNLITADSDIYTVDRTTLHSPIVYNNDGEIGPVKHDNYFMYKFDGFDLDNDVIIYLFDLGEGVGYDQIEAPLDIVPFDTTVAGTVIGAFPEGLTLDRETGWMYGYLPAQSDVTIRYEFSVFARKEFVTEPGYPGVDPTHYFSDRKAYTLTVTGLETGELTWITDEYLGELDNGEISQFVIEATIDNGNTVYFEILEGQYNRMVPGLQLLSNGLIIGRATFATFSIDSGATTFDRISFFIENETTFDQTYSFVVHAYDLEGTVNAVRTFTILIDRENATPYENLYLVGRLPLDERTKLKNLLDNRTIIVEDDVYRFGDTFFGIQNELRMLVVNGLNPTTAADMITAMGTMHFTKRLNFGDIKTAKVLDVDLNTVYEVVYTEIVDTTDTVDGNNVAASVNVVTSNIDGIPIVYPNNIVNMRKSLISQLGQVNKELPKWMVDRQDNGRVLGFTKACVLVYTKPEKSAKIAYQLSQLQDLDESHTDYFDFKEVTFEADRYLWDNDLLESYDKETMEFITSPETTYDIFSAGYAYVLVGNIKVYPFESAEMIHEPDGAAPAFHVLEPLGHFGSEYVLDPDSIPNANRTTFDSNSLRFLSGRDVYKDQDVNDKYLKFPDTSILGT